MILKTKDTRHGRLTYPANDKWIGQSLDWYGEYSEQECDAICSTMIEPGDVVVEVGANIGGLSVPIAKRLGPSGKLICFEPQHEIYGLLCANLSRNCKDRCWEAHESAVGDQTGRIAMQVMDYDGDQINIGGCEVGHGEASARIMRLDELGLERLDLLKADVEGFEADVLRGARETIKRCRPRLYVECDRQDKRTELLELIDELGYAAWWHMPPLFNPYNHAGIRDNSFGRTVSINVFAAPREKNPDVPTLEPVYFPRHDREFVALMRHQPPKDVKTACVYRISAIGDACQVASVFPGLKEQGYHVTFVTSPKGAEVCRHDPYIDEIVVQSADFGPPERIVQFWQTYEERFDKFINLGNTVEHTLLLKPKNIHYYWPQETLHRLCNHNYMDVTHEVAGVPKKLRQRFYPTAEETGRIMGWRMDKKRLCVVAPVGSGINKRWPHVIAFCDAMLGADPDMHIAVVGQLEPSYLPEHERLHPLAVSWPVRDVLTLALHADIVIGEETGVLNAVACEAMPKIVLLSHSSDENLTRDWTNTIGLEPRKTPCFPCHRMHAEWDYCRRVPELDAALCQANHSPDEVLALALDMLRDYEPSEMSAQVILETV